MKQFPVRLHILGCTFNKLRLVLSDEFKQYTWIKKASCDGRYCGRNHDRGITPTKITSLLLTIAMKRKDVNGIVENVLMMTSKMQVQYFH